LKAFLEIIESVVSSPFVKVEANSVEYFVVCASSLAMCAYQIGEHLHLSFAERLDLYKSNTLFNERREKKI
jgi:copper oxidase (laccase) domain-containing protein